MALQILTVLVLGLMCGSELNIALFGHPTLNRQPLDTHILVRSSFASLFGRVMPFWMSGSALLLLPFEHLSQAVWRLSVTALILQVGAVIFSLVAPVPINNRIVHWTPQTFPANWRQEEHLWDVYHWLRTSALIVAFVLLAVSIGVR
jgi:hypothetical protein